MSRLSTIIEERCTMSRPAIHAGEILAEEPAASGVTPTELARLLKVPASRITQMIQGKRSISGDTALRLGHWFGTSGQFWLNLQSAYDIRVAAQESGAETGRLPMRGRIPALPKFRSGGALVDVADRDALYHAMEGR